MRKCTVERESEREAIFTPGVTINEIKIVWIYSVHGFPGYLNVVWVTGSEKTKKQCFGHCLNLYLEQTNCDRIDWEERYNTRVNGTREKEYKKKMGMERWLTQSPHASLCLWQWWFPLCEQQYCNGRGNNVKINTKRCSSGLTPGPSSFLKADSEGRKLDTWGLDDRWNQNSEWEWRRWMYERICSHIHHMKTYLSKWNAALAVYFV